MTEQIFTMGYEGTTQDAFISRLKAGRITRVVDVRENAISRKRGFSKRALAEALSINGIEYVHERRLGCPRDVRDKYRSDENWSAYTRGFKKHLKEQAEAVAALAESSRDTNSCLVCFEADFNFCHRTFVARAVALAGDFKVIHLTSRGWSVDPVASPAA